MLFIKLDTMETANNVAIVCNKYDSIDIDLSHGRQRIDGKSFLGVASLIDKIVKIDFVRYGNDTKDIENDLKKIGAYEV